MITGSSGRIATVAARERETAHPGRVLHLVTDALPATSAGYTIRTHEIVKAQQAIGLDPYVATRWGYPVTRGKLDGRRLVTLDGIPYHRLLPWMLPGRADHAAALGLELAGRLTRQLRPNVLHAASNFANARLPLALRERYGLPVVYEVRGFWEDTWLSRHPDAARLARSELYQGTRDLETRRQRAPRRTRTETRRVRGRRADQPGPRRAHRLAGRRPATTSGTRRRCTRSPAAR